MKAVTETDDPLDPCRYCVQVTCDICGWDCQYDWEHIDEHWMYVLPSGPVERLYRGIHSRCQEAVDAYMAESDGL